MATTLETVTLDEDVQEDLRQIAERSGRPAEAVANEALREYVRYEKRVLESVERGIADIEAGRTSTTEEVRAFLAERRRQRASR